MTPAKFVLSLTLSQKRLIMLCLDTAMVPVAYLGSNCAILGRLTPFGELRDHAIVLALLMVGALALSSGLNVAGLRLKHFNSYSAIMLGLSAALLAAIGAALVPLFVTPAGPGFYVVFGLTYFALICSGRMALLHVLLAIYRRSGDVVRVLIYGAGRTGMSLAAALRDRPDIVAVGFVDDNATLKGLHVAGLPVHLGVRLAEVAKELHVDRVILAMPSLSEQRLSLISNRVVHLGVEVLTLPSFVSLFGRSEILERLLPTRPQHLLMREQMSDPFIPEASAYKDAAVLISGAGGTIGLELCRQILAQKPRRLVLFELSEAALYDAEREMSALCADSGTEIVSVLGSVTDAHLVTQVLKEKAVDVVLHAAAYKHVPIVEANVRSGVVNNALGTAVIAHCARECGVKRFVLVSTDKAVRPAGIMGASKRFAELVVQDLAMRSRRTTFSIVRFGNVLGSSGSVLPLFQSQIACGGPITITDEDTTRYFMTVREAAQLVLVAGSIAKGGEVFALDMGRPVNISELARRLIEGSGFTVRDFHNPDGDIEIVVTGLRLGEKLHEEPMLSHPATPTPHPKIFAVKDDFLSEIEMAAALRDIRDAVDAGDDAVLADRTMYWVRDRWLSQAGPAERERNSP